MFCLSCQCSWFSGDCLEPMLRRIQSKVLMGGLGFTERKLGKVTPGAGAGPGRAKAQLPAPPWEQVHQVPWERLAPDPKRDHEAGYWGAVQGTTAGKSGVRVFGHGKQALRAAVGQRPSSAMTVGSPEDSGCSAVLQGHGDPPSYQWLPLHTHGGQACVCLIKELNVH